MAEETHEVLMPLMGEGITEATLVKWLKRPGEPIKKEEPLLEVSTDKVDTEIPAPASGILVELLAKEGETVAVNSVIAHIGSSMNGASKAVPAAKAGATAVAKAEVAPRPEKVAEKSAVPSVVNAPPVAQRARSLSSPLVRKMAKAKNIDIAAIPGTGLGGRITKRDLEAALSGAATPRTVPAAPFATQASTQKGPAHLEFGRLETRQENGAELLDGVKVRRERMSKMRGLIAEHMVRSVRTSPHVTTVFEIDMHRVVKLREAKKAEFQAREGLNLTFTHFFVHAAVQAIKQHPIVNVSVDGDDILWKDSINIGVATAIETGLIVPVVRNAGELNLTGVARRISDLSTRARSKKLTPEDVQGGTFSVTNPGMFGSIVSAPIINQPQVAILSIGAIVKRPTVISNSLGDLIAVRPIVQIGLTFDHRVVDGEGGARYLATLKELLESYDESAL